MSDKTRLLIVDDEELNRDMLQRRLLRHGYEVETASSAAEGFALMEQKPVDLLLLDVQMPEMSGFDMLKELRTRFSPVQLPVIMVTAKSQSEDVVEAFDLGANDYVTKPVDLPVVLARIRTQIARRQAERQLVEMQERYTLAVRGTNDGLWDWKIDTNRLFFSPRWNQLMGGAAEESIGTLETWLERIHPEDVARVRTELDEHLCGLSPHFENEHRVRREDGQFGWVLVRGMVVRDADHLPTRMAGSMTDITEGKVADALTGLPNRVLYTDRLARLIEHQRRYPEFQFAVLFLDLDRFKNINDSFGHAAGDQLLIQAAQRLDQNVRNSDTVSRPEGDRFAAKVGGNTVARMGGDEFAILLTNLRDASDASTVADRICRIFQRPFTISGHEVFSSVSVGIALSGIDQDTPANLIRDADTALYRAKENGRGRFEVFDQVMRQEVMERLTGETDFRGGARARRVRRALAADRHARDGRHPEPRGAGPLAASAQGVARPG